MFCGVVFLGYDLFGEIYFLSKAPIGVTLCSDGSVQSLPLFKVVVTVTTTY